ncbi:hypothetical protein [Streptomyces sp. BF23-18]|uniref:hypothetical protein n=1 Tax=unclassified Streptomyces TaxID=2593676 RepID=UPI0034E3B09F
MEVIDWALLGLFWTLTLVPGTAAIRAGWVAPWFRKTVASPRLGGWADVCMGVGGTLTVGPVHRHLGSTPMTAFASVVGVCFVFLALGLYRRSSRPEPSGPTAHQHAAASADAAQRRDTATVAPATDPDRPQVPN